MTKGDVERIWNAVVALERTTSDPSPLLKYALMKNKFLMKPDMIGRNELIASLEEAGKTDLDYDEGQALIDENYVKEFNTALANYVNTHEDLQEWQGETSLFNPFTISLNEWTKAKFYHAPLVFECNELWTNEPKPEPEE